jgi:hypothetical protein
MRRHWSVTALILVTGCQPARQPAPQDEFEQRVAQLDQLFSKAASAGGTYLLRYDRSDHACRGDTSWLDPISKGLWRNGVSWYLLGTGGMMTTIEDLSRWNSAIQAGYLFRSDVQERCRAQYFGWSSRCRSDASFFGGSNGMTRSLIIHLPDRAEALVSVSTRRDHRAPREDALLDVICPK